MYFADSQNISKSWIQAPGSKQSSNTYKDINWAIELMMFLPEIAQEKTWEVIHTVYKSTDNSKVLSFLTAGPFESLMCFFGEQYLEKVRNESIIPRFIELMRQVFLSPSDTLVHKEFYLIAGIEAPIDE